MLTTAAAGGSSVVSVIIEWRTAPSQTFTVSPGTPRPESRRRPARAAVAPVVVAVGGPQDRDYLLHRRKPSPAPSRAQRGWMKTPSASTVMPSSSARWPAAKVFTPSIRVVTGLGVQVPEAGRPQIAEADRAGQARVDAVAGGFAEQVIENQGGDSPVHVAGRALVGRAEVKIAPGCPRTVALDLRSAGRSDCGCR